MQQESLLVILLAIGTIASTKEIHGHDCKAGFFKVQTMPHCLQWLKCVDLSDVHFEQVLSVGSTKVVYLSSWNGVQVAVSQAYNHDLLNDFYHGLEMLKKLNPSPYVVQLIGFCEKEHVIFTEYHRLGNATTIAHLLNERYGQDNILPRLKLCLNYVNILGMLHDGPIGTRVMCDSNDLNKLLSQLLITDELNLVLNDADALPLLNKNTREKIKCGSKEIFGDFVAPEQKWPFTGPFRDAAMPGYDEKTDIWKAADVCKYFLDEVTTGADWIQYRLFNLFKSCKDPDPNLRPSANYIKSVLEKVLAEISSIKTEL